MRKAVAMFVIVVIPFLSSLAFAGSGCPGHKAASDATTESGKAACCYHQVASYKVSDLTPELEKQLLKSLKDVDGVLTTKIDKEAGVLLVAFDEKKIDVDKISTKLTTVKSDLKLDTNAKTPGMPGCDHKKECTGKKDKAADEAAA